MEGKLLKWDRNYRIYGNAMTTGSETDPYRRNLIVYRRHIRSVGSSWNVTHWQREHVLGATSDHNSASTRAGFWGADSIDPKSKIKRYLVTHTHTCTHEQNDDNERKVIISRANYLTSGRF